MSKSPYTADGFNIIVNNDLTVDGTPYKVKRTMKQRWLTWPWVPLKTHDTIIPQIPDPNVIVNGCNIIGHSVTIDQVFKNGSIKSEELRWMLG